MPNYHLSYAISKRTPPNRKILKAILDAQAEMNRRFQWSLERLTLAPVVAARRAGATMSTRQAKAAYRIFPLRDAFEPLDPAQSSVYGSTGVGESLWNAYLVAAFLRRISAAYPALRLELREENGFLLSVAVSLCAGQVVPHRAWLKHIDRRLHAFSDDPTMADAYIWGRDEALQGRLFVYGAASDYIEVEEVREVLRKNGHAIETTSLEDAAAVAVEAAVASHLSRAA